MIAGLRLAVAMFTVLPVPRSWHATVAVGTRTVLAWLPLVGAGLGALAGLPAAAVLARSPGAVGLAAVVAVAALAGLTRGLHLDGLADTADGLASRAGPTRALEIMRRSDIGPFGVLAVVLALLVEVTALDALIGGRVWPVLAVLTVAAATGRLSVTLAGRIGVPAARPDGFGALVAGSVPSGAAAGLVVVVLGSGSALAAAVGASPLGWPLAQAVALMLGLALRRHLVRRLGGVTGDVFGALIEVTTALTLVGLVLTVH